MDGDCCTAPRPRLARAPDATRPFFKTSRKSSELESGPFGPRTADA
jgi:hypothetical protein